MKKILTFVLFLSASICLSQTSSWQFVSYFPAPNPDANSIYVVNNNIIWVASNAAGGAARIYKSTNGGINWLLRNGGIPSLQNGYGIFAFDTTTAFVGTTEGTLYKTTNGGFNWVSVFAVSGSFTNGVHMFNQNYGIYYGDPIGSGAPYQFRVTTNGGLNWNLPAGAPIAGSEYGVINAWDWTDSSHVWIGSANTVPSSTSAKVFRTSTGYYGSWSYVAVPGTGGTTGCYYQAVAFINASSGMVGSSGGDIKKTTDGGATWTAVTPPSGLAIFSVMSMNGLKDGSNTIRMSTAGDTTRLFKTTDLGTTWLRELIPNTINTLNISQMKFLSSSEGYAILGTSATSGGSGAFMKYALPSGINPVNGNVPAEFSLSQNYPNPFNPSTMIKFALPKSGNVSLKVYNSLGKEVQTLVNEQMNSGVYEVTFDASSLNSGIYFYRLNANGFSQTKRMMLVK